LLGHRNERNEVVCLFIYFVHHKVVLALSPEPAQRPQRLKISASLLVQII
jgi:hypothetical protein